MSEPTKPSNAESDAQGYGFIEALFGFEVDHSRVLREQAVCVTCGDAGFHTHHREAPE